MSIEDTIRKSLENVIVPEIKRSVIGLNLLRGLDIVDGNVDIKLASTALSSGIKEYVHTRTIEAAGKVPGVKTVNVTFEDVNATDINSIKSIIAVMSGKGGVGKSLVSGLIAVSLRRKGFEVGILDADITGPSIPRMFGVKAMPSGNEQGMLPVPSTSGIGVMSINLLLPSEDEAVIWRGPLISNTIKQFGEQVLWGNLDYLIVDLPPGTADAPLTIMQSFPISGVIIVSTPQDLVEMIVKKAVGMARKLQKKILGVVENMSYLYVPEIDKKIELFGKSKGEAMAAIAQAPLLGSLPIDPSLAALCDSGEIERYNGEIISNFSEALSRALGGLKSGGTAQ